MASATGTGNVDMQTKTILVLTGDSISPQFSSTPSTDPSIRLLAATSSAAALSLVRSAKPDLVIADLSMPGSMGYEFVKELREDESVAATKLILQADASGKASAASFASSCGARGLLIKPATIEKVLEAAKAALRLVETPINSGGDCPAALDWERFPEREESGQFPGDADSGYWAFFEANPVPMWVFDLDSLAFLAVNEAALQRYGYSRSEFLSMRIPDIRPLDIDGHAVAGNLAGNTRVFSPQRHLLKSGLFVEAKVAARQANFAARPAQFEVVIDAVESTSAEFDLRRTADRYRQLAARLREDHEQERIRIAHLLHDDFGQSLAAFKMSCLWIVSQWPGAPPEVVERLTTSSEQLNESIVGLRKLATELRPGILEFGLTAAIEWLAAETQSCEKIECKVEAGEEEQDVTAAVATAVFRVTQEALRNAILHSGATKVTVRLDGVEGRLNLEVVDNGCGISAGEIAETHSLGILGMSERVAAVGGSFWIGQGSGGGTTIRVSVPK